MTKSIEGRVSGTEAAHLAGITYRRLHHWKVIGYLHPITEADDGSGSGYTDWYSMSDVADAIRVRILTDAGLNLNRAWKAARDMRERESQVARLTREVVVMLDPDGP